MKEYSRASKYFSYFLTSLKYTLTILSILFAILFICLVYYIYKDSQIEFEEDKRMLMQLKNIYSNDFSIEAMPYYFSVGLTIKNKMEISRNDACDIYKYFFDYDPLEDEVRSETDFIYFNFFDKDKHFVFGIADVEKNKCIFTTKVYE